MGISELSNALRIDKSVVSRLVKKGMPTTSVDAAQAWRETNAPPRAKRGQRGTPPPAPKVAEPPSSPATPPASLNDTPPPPPPVYDSTPEPDDEDNTPRQSLRRARLAEKVGYNELVICKRNGGSIEDIRKANSTYISSRNNRVKAEKDFKDWQLQERKLLFFDEARDITSRPHIAAKQLLEVMPKTLAPRLHGQPQKTIEASLAEWADNLTTIIRQAI
jgi:type IV secretory pathway VirB10-like protein